MSVRINLSLEDDLFALILKQAECKKVSPNTEIISILEKIFYNKPFDYSSALNKMIEEIPLSFNPGKEFLLNELPCFQDVSMGKFNSFSHKYIPSTHRARLGSDFKMAVQKKLVPDVSIAKNLDGSEKVINKTMRYKYK